MLNPGGANVLGLVLGLVSTPGFLAADSRHELWVELVDTTVLSDESRGALREEVDAIYLEAGASIRWLAGESVAADPHVARVYLMAELPGSLDARLKTFGKNPMALALGRSGQVSGSTIYVARAAVAAGLTGGAAAEPGPEKLGRALGRIVAHELAHRFLQRQHTRRGILKAALNGGDLDGAADEFYLTAKQRARLLDVALEVEFETVSP